MLAYNLKKKGNKNCEGNKSIIRKNSKHMTTDEIKYLKSIIKKLTKKQITMTKHARSKNLIKEEEIIKIMYSNKYEIIDYNYNLDNKEERIVFRTKNTFEIKDINNNKIEKCFIKIVVDIKSNTIITLWGNKVKDEKEKQDNIRTMEECINNRGIKTNYIENFDIINKRIKF